MSEIKKVSLLRLIEAGLIFCVILSTLYIACTKCSDSNTNGVIDSGGLTKQEIIRIARKIIEERYGDKTDGFRVFYDNGNKTWDKNYVEYYPNLVGQNYQAVQFDGTGILQQGGGPFWVCVERKTGEVLVKKTR